MTRPDSSRIPAILVAAAIGVLAAIGLWRASLEGGIWADELYSLQIVNFSAEGIIDRTAIDQHPPLYYLLVKGWIHLARAAGHVAAIFWARLPGMAAWLLAVFYVWRAGGRLLGPAGGPLLAIAAACCGHLSWEVRNVRGYALTGPALLCAFMLMCELTWLPASNRRTYFRWAAYAVLAAAALWTNLLAAIVLLVLGVWWIGESVALAHRNGMAAALRSPFVIGGALAQGAAVASFAPWMIFLGQQAQSLARDPRRDWMTPPTLHHLLAVFAFWYPWGRIGENTGPPLLQLSRWGLGWATLFLPAMGMLVPRKRADASEAPHPAKRLAAAAIAVSLGNVLILWGSDRAGMRPALFHAPHYPMFTAPIWGIALAAGALWIVRTKSRGPLLAYVLLLPWLVANLAGLAIALRQEREGIHSRVVASVAEHATPGLPLFVFPSELIRYFPKALSPFDVRPIEALAGLPDGTAEANILHISKWLPVESERDAVAAAAIDSKELSDDIDTVELAPPIRFWDGQTFYRLLRPRRGAIQALAARDWRAAIPLAPANAIESISPVALKLTDGWQFLEVGPGSAPRRWTNKPRAVVRLGRSLPAGRVAIQLVGYKPASAAAARPIRVGFRDGPSKEFPAPPGWFDATLTFTLVDALEEPVVYIEFPVQRRIEYEPASGDPRQLGLLLTGLHVLPAE